MAGHSKWKNILHRKEKQDFAKARLYNKYSRDIMISAANNPDSEKNIQLKSLIKLAKNNGVPKEVIEKAIKKAIGGEKIIGEFVLYEARLENYAFLIKTFTNNRNRIAGYIRDIFKKTNGHMASCEYLFQRIGKITIIGDLEQLMDLSLDFENFEISNIETKEIILYFSPEIFKQELDKIPDTIIILDYQLTYIPYLFVDLKPCDEESIKQILTDLDSLDEIDDYIMNF